MGNFYTDTICKSPLYGTTKPCDDLSLLEPVTRAAVLAIIADAKAQGVEFRVLETYRSQALQQHYFQTGATHLRQVGVHHYGLACDLGMFVDGKMVADGTKYGLLRFLAEKHGLISGGDWGTPTLPHSFRDYDHVQRPTLSRQNDLFRGTWYPDHNYNPLQDLHRTKPTPAKLKDGRAMPWLVSASDLEAA